MLKCIQFYCIAQTVSMDTATATSSNAGATTEDEYSYSDADADDDPEFFFESDHLALRGNPDYTAVLRTIAILQTQRIQVTKDIDRLASAKKAALDAPEEFIQQLAKGELKLPGPISVIDVSWMSSFCAHLELQENSFVF